MKGFIYRHTDISDCALCELCANGLCTCECNGIIRERFNTELPKPAPELEFDEEF